MRGKHGTMRPWFVPTAVICPANPTSQIGFGAGLGG
jgi:hypothetical protein